MASIIPSQERAIDPFASYNSNVVNRITEISTQGTEGMLTVNSMQVVQDSTSPNTIVIVQPGYAVKDDVLIKITAEHTVDFTDDDQWVTPPGILFPGGNCYVVLDYQYLKQRPAPQANIKILQPGERSLIGGTSTYLLLKVVKTSTSSPHNIVALYDYDPEVGYESNERQYLKYYASGTVNLPIHDQVRDQGRMVYESIRNKYYFGYDDGWRELSAGGISIDINTDSTGVIVGSLCYVDDNRDAALAIATSTGTGADIIVLSVGTSVSGEGRCSVAGFAEDVPVSTGILINIGDLLYLSDTEAGTVTNVKTTPFYQVVGRALSQGSSTTPIDMIFSPKLVLSQSIEGQITSWLGPDGNGDYFANIDVSSLDGTNAFDCHWFNDSTDYEVRPSNVQIISEGTYIRVYMPDSTSVINYLISAAGGGGGVGGGGGGGGSGVTDHSLLTSLGYAASGHTGFAPTVHTHPQYIDVPSGTTILFESNIAIAGYTLLTTHDDMLIYVTKGSAAGGEAAGYTKAGGTWTQPNHAHTITTSGDHAHTGPNHIHSTAGHTLTINEIPAHNHTAKNQTGLAYGQPFGGVTQTDGVTGNTGGGASHSHGNTGYAGTGGTSSDGDHAHGGATVGGATANTWRPTGINFTRQERI